MVFEEGLRGKDEVPKALRSEPRRSETGKVAPDDATGVPICAG